VSQRGIDHGPPCCVRVQVEGLSLDQVKKMTLGDEGSLIELGLERPYEGGQSVAFNVQLLRGRVSEAALADRIMRTPLLEQLGSMIGVGRTPQSHPRPPSASGSATVATETIKKHLF